MSDYIKETPLNEIIDQYFDNHGFVLLADYEIPERAIIQLAENIKKQGISNENPLLVTRVKNGVLFAYDDFDGPTFFQVADHCGMFCNVKVVPLYFYLKNKKESQ